MEDNTILITGGASGIGRGLAEALHKKGNKVIIAGRRKNLLMDVCKANEGMEWMELHVEDATSIKKFAEELIRKYPTLNVLFNNAGVMQLDDVTTAMDDDLIVSIITTNLMGPMRLTSALIEHLKGQKNATIINTTSVLGFLPLTTAAVYSATKAAMHSYSQSLRYRLKDSQVKVLELAPPWVQTDLLNSNEEPRAMPLAQFIEETMEVLSTDDDEVLVASARQLRNLAGPNEWPVITQFNDDMINGNTH